MTTIDRNTYASMFGPTTGDRVRLGDTALTIEVEKDFATYGEEVKFGAVSYTHLTLPTKRIV